MSTVKFINEINQIYVSVRTLSTESRSTSGISMQTDAHGKIEMCAVSNYLNIKFRHSFDERQTMKKTNFLKQKIFAFYFCFKFFSK